MKVAGLEILRCDPGWRNYHFLKLTTDNGIPGWSEFDEGFGSPGVGAVIERLAGRVIGVRTIGAKARDKGFGALKTNVFTYDSGAPRGWRPGFGGPFMPEFDRNWPFAAGSA